MTSHLSQHVIWPVVLAVFILPPSCTLAQKGETNMIFTLSSKSILPNQPISDKYTCFDKDISPQLQWSNTPTGTRAFVLICDDPDAPAGTWIHWVLYDIPSTTSILPEGLDKTKIVLGNAKQGINDFGKIGYNGPMPPPGRTHRYFFKIYAVDKETGMAPGMKKDQVIKTIEGHILGQAEIIGTYRRH